MRVLMISSMYAGYLESFYNKNSDVEELSYPELYNMLLNDSTEFVASYVRAFNESGVEATAIILNDMILQNKWKQQFESANNGQELLFDQISLYKPDVLWIEDLRFTDNIFLHQIKKKSGIKLLVAYHCAPWNIGIISKLKEFDIIITCTPGLQKDFENSGLKSFLVYHGFDPGLIEKIGPVKSPVNQVIFSGSLRQGKGYHGSRIKLLEYLLEKGINISLYITTESQRTLMAKKMLRLFYLLLRSIGISNPENIIPVLNYGKAPVESYPEIIMRNKKDPQFGIDMYRLLQQSEIVLNNHGEIAGAYAGNMRMFEATGVGSCLLTENKDNIGDLFEPGREIVVYDSPEDCAAKIRWLLEHEDERKRIALAGQQRTLNFHIVQNRCSQIIEIIKSELKQG